MKRETQLTQYEQLRKKWESLGIASDVMFGMLMQKKELCLELIQRAVPELKVQKIEFHQHQYTIDGPLDSRGSRFDIYARDDQGRIFMIEMQVANHHNLPYRLRYYLRQSDFDILNPGDGFEKLAAYPTYVIIFCDFDYYGKGRARYQFENRDSVDHDLKAGDGLHEIIFNAKAAVIHDKMKIKSFLQLMENKVNSRDPFVVKIMETMREIKADPERRRSFMTYEMNLADARAAGRERGLEEGMAEGRREGMVEGHKQGMAEGHKQGMVEGHKQGMVEGHKQGMAEGHKQGIAEGRKEGLTEAAKKAAVILKKYEPNHDEAVQTLMDQFDLSTAEAEAYLK